MKEKIWSFIKDIFERDRFVERHKTAANLRNKQHLQLLVSFAFLILSVANIITRSYTMLILTVSGSLINFLFAFLARKFKRSSLCAASAIITCSALFVFFVIYGGNDGFACQWVILLPLLSMVVMSFSVGLCASVFFQIFLIVVFWTPVREHLLYRYGDEFCLRFPLFFFVAFLLGLLLTVSLRKSEYNECKHLLELEKMTDSARNLARTDPLTKLANRRYAYEEFETKFIAEGHPHCIVMGDIDYFKKINDTYGHEFGDEVLIAMAALIKEVLPEEYLKSRWGGEEFLFAANAPIEKVYDQIEGLRQAVSAHAFYCNGLPIHITITFGIAEYTDKEGLLKAIKSADDRLYIGKKMQRNCTVR